jgi:2-polyprenyl-6-methoxyphenol hydroxylase-like FAD-dependent oxidoreductase
VSRILILGGGVCGLAAGIMLARDGHAVTLLERDGLPAPESMESAWSWERGGVPHFRQPHGLDGEPITGVLPMGA